MIFTSDSLSQQKATIQVFQVSSHMTCKLFSFFITDFMQKKFRDGKLVVIDNLTLPPWRHHGKVKVNIILILCLHLELQLFNILMNKKVLIDTSQRQTRSKHNINIMLQYWSQQNIFRSSIFPIFPPSQKILHHADLSPPNCDLPHCDS